MEPLESDLTDLYSWCFSVPPDTVAVNSASSTDGSNLVEILQDQTPEQQSIWLISVSTPTVKITAFEADLTAGMNNFKSAWTNRNNT